MWLKQRVDFGQTVKIKINIRIPEFKKLLFSDIFMYSIVHCVFCDFLLQSSSSITNTLVVDT